MFSQWNPGCVERVKKIRDYSFVHFTSRDDAVIAMDHLNGTEVEGSCIEVTLAKPVDKEQYSRQKASKGAPATPEPAQQNYIYQCDRSLHIGLLWLSLQHPHWTQQGLLRQRLEFILSAFVLVMLSCKSHLFL